MSFAEIWQWVLSNYKWISLLFVMVLILALTGTITAFIKLAIEGLKKLFTPLGMIVFFIVIYIALMIWQSFQEVLP